MEGDDYGLGSHEELVVFTISGESEEALGTLYTSELWPDCLQVDLRFRSRRVWERGRKQRERGKRETVKRTFRDR